MDDNIVPADQSQAFLQRAQSQSAWISPWRVVGWEPFYFSWKRHTPQVINHFTGHSSFLQVIQPFYRSSGLSSVHPICLLVIDPFYGLQPFFSSSNISNCHPTFLQLSTRSTVHPIFLLVIQSFYRPPAFLQFIQSFYLFFYPSAGL